MIAQTDLTAEELRTALAYYTRFPREIDEFIALNRRPLAELQAAYPHAEVITVEPGE
jgi:hypothetical protein